MSNEHDTHGRITYGPTPGSVVDKTLEFVYEQLPIWRDKPHREKILSEEALNSQLCKHLNAAARRENFAMAHFHHEERQGDRRRVDLSAQPFEEAFIEGRTYQDDQPFPVLEGKRLPADRKSREREYVTGDKQSGGIQRFKLGLHGPTFRRAAIIAYVQEATCSLWLEANNGWIKELALVDNQAWTTSDQLNLVDANSELRSSRSSSNHSRVQSESNSIDLTHLWIEM